MFKVMCIHKAPTSSTHPELIAAAEQIQVGSVYTVIDEDNECYELAEFKSQPPYTIMWEKEYFAPMPDITADDMAEAEHEAIVNLETV